MRAHFIGAGIIPHAPLDGCASCMIVRAWLTELARLLREKRQPCVGGG